MFYPLFSQAEKDGKRSLIAQQFDACASWWTQGPDVALQVKQKNPFLSLTMLHLDILLIFAPIG